MKNNVTTKWEQLLGVDKFWEEFISPNMFTLFYGRERESACCLTAANKIKETYTSA